MPDHRSYAHNLKTVVKLKPQKIQASVNGIQTHDLCSALPTELSSQLGADHFVSS